MNGIHICRGSKDEERVSYMKCPSCKREHAQFYGWRQDWYGWTITCTECGEKFSDGEWLERPWKAGWREENILKALECIDNLKKGLV